MEIRGLENLFEKINLTMFNSIFLVLNIEFELLIVLALDLLSLTINTDTS